MSCTENSHSMREFPVYYIFNCDATLCIAHSMCSKSKENVIHVNKI